MSALVRGRQVLAPSWAPVLLALLLIVGGAVPAHVHSDVSPGLYNTAHVLETLAARSADVSMPEASPVGVVDAPGRIKLSAGEPVRQAPILRGPDSRAPPSA